jgi:N-acetylglucosaminyl-diphospho-decaprenol L-rhamnosyltransferase
VSDTDQPDLSVLIVSWNTSELLARCLTALAAEPGAVAVEVIVVDNGSTDGSGEMVASDFAAIKLIANPDNRGFAAANNQGITVAKGRYICLLNSDTAVEPGSLRSLLDFADANPEAGILGPQLLNPDGSLQPSGGHFPTPLSTVAELLGLDRLTGRPRYGTRRNYSQPALVDEVSGAALLIRATLLRELGGLDESFAWGYEDVDLCRRAKAAGWSTYYVPAARVRHEWGASRRLAPAATVLSAIRGRRHYFRKHHGRSAAALVMAATLKSHALRTLLFAAAGIGDARLRARAAIEWEILRGLVGGRA